MLSFCIKLFEDITAITHTHSTHSVMWAQAGRDLPAYGTTHADAFMVSSSLYTPINERRSKRSLRSSARECDCRDV